MIYADDEDALARYKNFQNRKEIAARILQGIASNPRWAYTNDQMVKEAISLTDKLLKGL